MKYKRIFLIVLDSLGVGEASDAELFNDLGANTLGHILAETKVSLPNLEQMGLLNLVNKSNVLSNSYYTRANEASNGKDTLTGHLEMMGIITKKPFRTFTETGFPQTLLTAIKEFSGRDIIGNCNASGTAIIEQLGKEQMETGALIVYTSADSVLQIAAHEDIIPLTELYKICEFVRSITIKEEYKVGRIIARPYTGEPGNFVRTSNRHDYALNPVDKTVLDYLAASSYEVISIGKISDIFNNCGITKSLKIKNNLDGIKTILNTIDLSFTGLCFANLNDFDSLYGHRRNVLGYSLAIKEFDEFIPAILNSLRSDDLLIITADHGNDPTYKGTDHTRENTPVLVYNKNFTTPGFLEPFQTFADIGITIADNFNVDKPLVGESFLSKLK